MSQEQTTTQASDDKKDSRNLVESRVERVLSDLDKLGVTTGVSPEDVTKIEQAIQGRLGSVIGQLKERATPREKFSL